MEMPLPPPLKIPSSKFCFIILLIFFQKESWSTFVIFVGSASGFEPIAPVFQCLSRYHWATQANHWIEGDLVVFIGATQGDFSLPSSLPLESQEKWFRVKKILLYRPMVFLLDSNPGLENFSLSTLPLHHGRTWVKCCLITKSQTKSECMRVSFLFEKKVLQDWTGSWRHREVKKAVLDLGIQEEREKLWRNTWPSTARAPSNLTAHKTKERKPSRST